MTLVQLKYFQTVCRYGNITRAAGELHISQPSLSNAMKELEREFGISLFYRLSRGMELTEEGRIFLEEAEKLLRQADLFEERMYRLGGCPGTVRLGVPPMLSALVFPRLLAAFRRTAPGATLKMEEGGTLSNREMVLDGRLEGAVISCLEELPPALGFRDLGSAKIRLYLSASHELASEKEIDLAQAGDIPLAMLPEDSFLTDFMQKSFRERGIVPDIIIKTNQLAAIGRLVEENVAGAFLFDHILPENPGIVTIPVRDLPGIGIRLIWNRNRKQTAAMNRLIRAASGEFSKL